MQVLKFGGSSVADAATMTRVVEIVKKAVARDKTLLVASAISGATDQLIAIARMAGRGDEAYLQQIHNLEERHLLLVNQLIPTGFQVEIQGQVSLLFDQLRDVCKGVFLIRENSRYTTDVIMSFGELLSTKILLSRFASMGIGARWVDTRELIKTYPEQSQKVVNLEVTYDNIARLVTSNSTKLFILPGFIASDAEGRTTTLGRGGSDYTAALLAVGSNARILEIWTDVNGMMTADPRVVPQAKTITHISYKEALELSHFGAKVVYPPTIQPVVAKGIPILVKNTFDPQAEGTLIEKNPPEGSNNIKGISASNRIALLSMEGSGMVGIPGYSSRLFDALTRNQINIILITQASSVHTMLVAIEEQDALKAKQAADATFAYEISLHKVEPLKVECGFSIISLVGDDMKNQSGASGRMFEAMGRRGVNIRAIAQGSSEKNVSAVVETAEIDVAVQAIHQEFFGVTNKRINLFLAGCGNVGKPLLDMIYRCRGIVLENRGIELVVMGLSNSRRMVINKQGFEKEELRKALAESTVSSSWYLDQMMDQHLTNCVFVDCTSDKYLAARYAELLRNKIGVVTCNKIANASSMEYYRELRLSARLSRAPFLYETNVGAALPVVSLLQQMIQSGDTVYSLEASLSGTLNYVFSTYDASCPFEEVVNKAKSLGYTEPNPLTDLSGTDVLRKALILAREIGMEVDDTDVQLTSFMPTQWPCEEHFEQMYKQAVAKGERLRYLVKIEKGTITVGLESLRQDHPFYYLCGTDSALLIRSRCYPNGLKVEGAGAGGEQTASGMLNDILHTV